ncbi:MULTISPECIES: hypothetical protein [unclassified Rhodococcus (in: high G+C Gram-positive bacteria)]|uniref:hypothetical protein n=1 Tax=unclassified Rhodococcus (in: high G+C Gram-positive bacteria) TaxID=192944 RepID=UPI0006FAFD27|nr:MULTISPECIES: hypothetical protein [unclassified Rhodococcus (in: high G+C Gram-positive bacteria)]KQU28379.1 hypothetical protein ASG69_10190 [Rhodococcus sp. Leaf225]KQU46486.1 hypothetical protein ASH03_07225 [Rhodococcus sp. Leaf258]
MTFDEVADELYGLDPSDFVATRTGRQKQARSDGDKDLAKQIGALRKPTIVGWVLNVTVRDAEDDVTDLLDLGEALREAQQHLREGRRPAGRPSGATLRTLTKQRQRAVRALANRAAKIAEDRGHPIGEDVGREVTQSLNAALSDADIADEVRRGRMLGAAEYSRFGPMGLVSVDPEPAKEPEPAPDDTAEREMEEQRARAQAELDDAEAALQDATEALEHADHRVDELQESVDALTEQLEKAREDLEAAQDARSEAASEKDASTSRVRNATKRLDRL